MRKQGVVAFDIDGVLTDFTLGFTRMAALLGLVKHEWSTDQQKTWDFDFHVDLVWAAVDANPRFWFDLDPLVTVGEIGLMNDMAEKASVIYVTGRHGTAEKQTTAWLERYGLPEGPVFFDADKEALYRSLGKQLVAAIDDRPVICALWGKGLPVYTRVAPYNRDKFLGPQVTSIEQFYYEVAI